MYLDLLKNDKDIRYCIESYMKDNDETFLPSDFMSGFLALAKANKTEFVRLIKRKDTHENIGWIGASVVKQSHMLKPILTQMYYHSTLKGLGAARCLIFAHTELIKLAEQKKIHYVGTACSHMDDKRVLVKILQLQGWDVRGHVAVWRTSHSSNPSTPPLVA
jgi:hypothetical protein